MHYPKVYYKTTKDCYYCQYIANCKERINAKKIIDKMAKIEKQKVVQLNLMPAYKDQRTSNFYSGVVHRSKKSRKRFLKHLHHDYDVVAAVKVWNEPSLLKHIMPSSLGETKNKNDPLQCINLQQKIDRHVVEYHIYDFVFKHKIFTVKTELTIHGYEQFYALYEFRNTLKKTPFPSNQVP